MSHSKQTTTNVETDHCGNDRDRHNKSGRDHDPENDGSHDACCGQDHDRRQDFKQDILENGDHDDSSV